MQELTAVNRQVAQAGRFTSMKRGHRARATRITISDITFVQCSHASGHGPDLIGHALPPPCDRPQPGSTRRPRVGSLLLEELGERAVAVRSILRPVAGSVPMNTRSSQEAALRWRIDPLIHEC